MSEKKYSCKHCKYDTTKRQYWYSHIKTSKHKKNEEISLEKEKLEKEKLEETLKISQKTLKKPQTPSKITCKYCNKKYTRKDNLDRHLDNRCKTKIELDKKEAERKKNEEEEIDDKKKEEGKNEDKKMELLIQFIQREKEEQRKEKEEQRKEKEEQRKEKEEQRKEKEEQRKLMEKMQEEQRKLMEHVLLTNHEKKQEEPELKEEQLQEMVIKLIKETQPNSMDQSHNKPCLDLQLTEEYKLEYRIDDGYVNITGLCQVSDKRLNDWFRLQKTTAFINKLSKRAGIPAHSLTYISKGGPNNKSWVHPQIAINIAQWVSPDFDILVSSWVHEIIATGQVNVYNTKSYNEIVKINKGNMKRIKYLESKILKKQKNMKKYEKNIVYLITTDLLEKERRYIIGKTTNFKSRLQNYNKTDEHKLIYTVGCSSATNMTALETTILNKLYNYKERANRERVVLPLDKTIDFFIEVFDVCYDFLENTYDAEQPNIVVI